MDWAVEQSSNDVLLDDGSRQSAERLLEIVEGLIDLCRSQTGERTLTDLYLCLLGGFYSTLLGELPEHVRISQHRRRYSSSPADTADRPRFDIVDIFLDPATRDVARRLRHGRSTQRASTASSSSARARSPSTSSSAGAGAGRSGCWAIASIFELPDASRPRGAPARS
jgi:hypothetical protein